MRSETPNPSAKASAAGAGPPAGLWECFRKNSSSSRTESQRIWSSGFWRRQAARPSRTGLPERTVPLQLSGDELRDDPGEDAEESAFPPAVAAQDRDAFPGADIELKAFDDRGSAGEAEAQPAHREAAAAASA